MIGRGSEWCRWEPHIHAPGTVMNNQFSGATAWEDYLTALENASPQIEAVAVTDYYVTNTYEQVVNHKASGRLPSVKLVFPNIELRLDVATARGGFVNLHLFVSPDEPDHIEEIQRLLSRLHFSVQQDRFDCTKADLIRLGKKVDPRITDDSAALAYGANQFKVNFKQLRDLLGESEFARKNILVAVAGGSVDGTAGVREAADQTIRREIESFAHVIFASSSAQREFWLGQRVLSPSEIQANYNGLKPCLHGSDAHKLEDVATPFGDRYSWIKGGLEFDTLRQACIDPEGRAYVGSEPPCSAMPSQVISQVSINNAPWATTPQVPLNPGLVAIIGARGSGKTAFADITAAGCDSIVSSAWNENENTSPSFLVRAKQHIGEATVTIAWGGGEETSQPLGGLGADEHLSFPRARYLSQQFVEELCSSNGISDGLIEEVERVILEAHPLNERENATEFSDFRDNRTGRFRQARIREVTAISDLSERIATELEKEGLIETYKTQVNQKKILVGNYNSDLSKLVVQGTETQVKRHAELSKTAQAIRSQVQAYTDQKRTFVTMQDEVASTRATRTPELLRQTRERHSKSGLNDQQWNDFLLIFKGDVDKCLEGYIAWADKQISDLKGAPPPPRDPQTPFIADDADLATLKLSIIEAEMARLEALFSADKVVRDQYTALTRRIGQENTALKALEEKLTDAQDAANRRKALQTERDEAYKRVFEAIINEQTALAELYAPLMERLSASSGTLKKLGFYVRRIVDVESWGAYAEKNLLDLRKAGLFNGRGSLIALAEENLKHVWEEGSADEVQVAMSNFISSYMADFLAHAPFSPAQQIDYKNWLKQFAHWLFGTEHVSIRYEIVYDGTDIRKLSPGTRGIVLLLLYLALDEEDDRPLIIDQPEENLDPKSVNDELVPLFIAAKSKRQVIIVTHNANLVINTDADQVIVAEAGAHQVGGLPPITYKSGGLENASIRKAVCDILEGGDKAFRERARRLRVRLER